MAGFFRKILGHLGLGRVDNSEEGRGKAQDPPGFASKLAVSRSIYIPPVVSECTPGTGGVQGLQWYVEKLMMDEDGDVAQEFLIESIRPTSASSKLNFEVEVSAKAAKLKGPLCTLNGNVYQYVEAVPGVHSRF